MFWEFMQQQQIYDASREARDASHRARETGITMQTLSDRVDRLTLVCRSMWELLKAHTGLTEEQLLEKMSEVDLSDGRMDGIYRSFVECGKCQRRLNGRQPNCLYCGAPLPGRQAFDNAS